MFNPNRPISRTPDRIVRRLVFSGCCVLAAVASPYVDPTRADENAPVNASPEARVTFERKIAPLLARHCLECHDRATREGGLDLSGRDAAFAGGDGGPAIVRGDADASSLWQYVETDEMPLNRAPLSDDEKRTLKAWLDGGAVWSLSEIDPDAYLHEGQADELWVQRLTVPEYIATVRGSLGVDIADQAERVLPRDERADGFANTSYNLGVDLEHIQAYARLASIIVDRMDVKAYTAGFVDCADLDRECFDRLVRRMGRSLLRGPLSDHEIRSYRRIAEAVQEQGGDFHLASRYLIEAMLQSPRFIYRIERQAGDGSTRELDGYELASRLSYILWGAAPDETLLDLAQADKLGNEKVLRDQVRRMLEDPRAVDRSSQFIYEWLDLGRLDSLRPNEERFPTWDRQLAADMREETVAFFGELAWERERPLWELMNAQFTYATPRLAYHYGLFADDETDVRRGDDETAGDGRVRQGLLAIYEFAHGRGDSVPDRSGKGGGIDLQIADPAAVRWREDGLEIQRPTTIATGDSPGRMIDALQKSRELTLEAWVTPADTSQSGPARMLTLSNGISSRNFTLGQDGDKYDFRLRTSKTDNNGLPSLASPSGTAVAGPTHVAVTRQKSGKTRIFINGQEVASQDTGGDFGKWDKRFRFAIANETSGDRGWLGTLHLAAIYDRALSADEVRQNHAAGGGIVEDKLASLAVSAAWRHADRRDLISLYRFGDGGGDEIRDRSGSDVAMPLRIKDPAVVSRGQAGLAVYGSTQIDTGSAAKGLTRAIKKTNAFSVEAWVTPADTRQNGPARIVTLSSGSGDRNFTLGQEGDRFDARIRAEKNDRNGLPSLASRGGSATTALTHLVLTKDASGTARLFVDGEEQASRDVGGKLSGWDEGYKFGLANETSGDRPWQGKYHLVAIYSRALSPEEIRSRGSGLARYDLADNRARGGLLTQGSVLTIGGDEASMVARGLFVLHDLLYSRVGNPPACVDTTPVPTKAGMSMRDLAEARLADSSCVGCHAKFEPLAFGLEKFDGVGSFHEIDEHGNRLREDGEILFPGAREPVAYETSDELMRLLAGSDRVRMAITRKLTQFALGRPLTAHDLPHLKTIHETAVEDGGTYRALMTAIVTSDLVRQTRTESPVSTDVPESAVGP